MSQENVETMRAAMEAFNRGDGLAARFELATFGPEPSSFWVVFCGWARLMASSPLTRIDAPRPSRG